MALFKEVWQFRSQPAYKWSEIYYRVQSSVEGLIPVPQDLIRARLALLDDQATFVQVRYSDVDVPRKTTVSNVRLNGLADQGAKESPANAGEAMILNLASTVTPARRKLWLRGLSESSMFRSGDNGEWALRAGFDKQAQAFLESLAKNQYLIAVTEKPGSGEILLKQIVSCDGTVGNGTSVLTMNGGLGAVAGDWIIIRKGNPKHAPGLSGTFQVLASNAETFQYTIRYRTPGNILLNGLPLGEAYKRHYLQTAVISVPASGFFSGGTRQTKNPNTASRGARRAVRLRQLA